jgi:hypothetical protein
MARGGYLHDQHRGDLLSLKVSYDMEYHVASTCSHIFNVFVAPYRTTEGAICPSNIADANLPLGWLYLLANRRVATIDWAVRIHTFYLN